GRVTMEVRMATAGELDVLVPLFDAYRQFYRKASDPDGARRFLAERFAKKQSTIFLAWDGGQAVGFTQLYPSFSSASMGPIYILNDLFVSPDARKLGVGRALLDAAARFGRQNGALRLALSTELTNHTAQALYEKA